MLNKEIVAKINKQINFELYSAYIYLDISNYYADSNLNGFANWFKIQTQEERDHAMLFMNYLLNNGEKVVLEDIKAPDLVYTDFRQPAMAAYEHEVKVTASIHDIYGAAYELKDFRTMQFLDWFVKEQNEEEKNTDEIIKRYDLFGSDPKGLYLLDSELTARVYTPPSLVI
ncbi:ferritin [Lacrimispora celerecrescens]|uniref:Ferritin n=1 Tax=[Clostridium] celerecrescens 18A TaxID=1286362 RepID=A0A2M8Z7K9_9FIRM|nr:ferritin [Lacrimispora celerecrescens]PJJ29420.1 ferritin [[Clostridium] celerecrescens 18A]